MADSVRLDVWLDVACLFKTRSEAQRACKSGRVVVNGVVAKAHREVRIGDALVIHRPGGRRQTLEVYALADKHIAKAEARALYEDKTPPPSPEEIELRRQERVFRAASRTAGRPGRDQRRQLRRAHGKV
jgi:ribosome-associated heat shock protein Hsp15